MKKIMYEQIYEDIINGIQDGVYEAGGLLPSEKELAMKYNVSRITTGKAMTLLTDRGIVERVRGKGTFVRDNAKNIINEESEPRQELYQGISMAESNMLGVVVDAFNLDFGTHLLKGIERECHRNNLSMLLYCTYGDPQVENEAIRTALANGCKGLLLMTVQGEVYNEMILKLVLNKVPIVLIDREMKGLGIPCVKTDNYKATWELTELLVEQGHRKICLVNHKFETTPTIEERNNAFRDYMMQNTRCQGSVRVLKKYKPSPEEMVEAYAGYDLEEVETLVQEEDCTAFLAVEYKLGMMLRLACEKLEVQRKICVFDDLDEMYNKGKYFVHVKQNEYQMGIEAVKTIKRVIEGESIDMTIYIPHKIVK